MKTLKTAEELKQDVVNQLSWDNRVNSKDVTVQVEDDNTIILEGKVATYSNKITAADIAWSVIGVNNVENNIKVEFPKNYTAPTDEELSDNIKNKLLWNIDINSRDIDVEVDKGIVTLEGNVPSFWQKINAESEAKNTQGVVAVINKLAVVPTEKSSDKLIGERVMNRIENNTVANVDKVDAQVEEGIVTLTGTVPTWDAWKSIYDAAQYTVGVKNVKDNLTIKYA